MSINNYMSNNNAVEILTDYAGAINVKLTQCSTMPTASIDNLNLIIQYIGATTNNYTNGYFYKCIEDPENSGSYIWENISVQEGGSGSGIVIEATLLANAWDANNRQTLTFTGLTSDLNGVIGMPDDVTAAQKTAYSTANVRVYSISGTSITFECENIPSIDLPVALVCSGGGGGGDVEEEVISDKSESSSTASMSHNEGSYFIDANGNLVKTTSAITEGDTIEEGVNVEVTSIGEVLEEINNTKADVGTIPVNPSSTEGMNIWIET